MAAKNEVLVTINLKEFPEVLRRKAKIKAATLGITMKELFIRALTEYIKNH